MGSFTSDKNTWVTLIFTVTIVSGRREGVVSVAITDRIGTNIYIAWHIHAHIHAHIHTHIHTYIHTFIFTCISTSFYVNLPYL